MHKVVKGFVQKASVSPNTNNNEDMKYQLLTYILISFRFLV